MLDGGDSQEDILTHVEPLLLRSPSDHRPVVLMICGLAGSGKSTLAKAVLARLPQYTRLSIDEFIFTKHGLYGIDYPADAGIYQGYQDEANDLYLSEFKKSLKEGKDVVLDRSFYARKDRDNFRALMLSSGARCVLVYLKVTDKEFLWKRICVRNQGERDADSALDISRERFELYWSGFDEPLNESEVVVVVKQAS